MNGVQYLLCKLELFTRLFHEFAVDYYVTVMGQLTGRLTGQVCNLECFVKESFSQSIAIEVADQNELSPIERVGRTDSHDRQRLYTATVVPFLFIGSERFDGVRSIARENRNEERSVDRFAWRPLFFAARASERFIIARRTFIKRTFLLVFGRSSLVREHGHVILSSFATRLDSD